jgi:hypothetical protein
MANKTDFGAVLVSGLNFNSNVRNEPDKQPAYTSLPVKGDGLINRASGLHTVQIHTINFTGNIQIEGTLDSNICNATWISAPLTNTVTGNTTTTLSYTFNIPIPGQSSSGKTVQTNDFYIASGQFAWLRANISNMAAGVVDLIKVAF